MRSFPEISFRLRQELANGILLIVSPSPKLHATAPLPLLPSPGAIADAVRGTEYAADLLTRADRILLGRIPLFDGEIECDTAIAWRRDPVRGAETSTRYFRFIPYLDPVACGDHKWIWELNRHQYLVLLAQAFVITGSTAYLDEVVRQLQHWWAENPFQRGINWTSALEVGFRALSWMWIWHLLGEKMSPDLRRHFLAEIYRHGLHLEYNLSIYFSPNTHLLGEAVALHALGRLFRDFPRAQRWRDLGRKIVDEQMQVQVKADGSHFEQSTYYHVYALDLFLLHAALEDVSDGYRDGLARMSELLASLVTADGELPMLGDDDGGRIFHPFGKRTHFARATLATASLMLRRSFFPYSERDFQEIALWWLGPEKCKHAEAPAAAGRHSQAFHDSGLVVMRHGNISAVFDAGPFGPWGAGHSHADTLSLVISAGEEEILIDPGTYTYLDPQWREAFRGTAAHNTVRIDRKDQADPEGPFRWKNKPEVRLLEFSSTADQDRAVGICRYHGFTHKRTIEFRNAREFHILDDLDGPPGEHLVEQFWHVGASAEQTAAGSWRIGKRAELVVEGGQYEAGWHSRTFGSKEKSPVVVVRQSMTFPAALQARLIVLG